jgi:tRNA dimethylallyltransferase
LPCNIISVDSAMVYRGMDIGTAKPGPEVLERAPHLLIDVLDPAESYSVGRFRRDALREMESIASCGRIPLLVGGTMLYFRALEEGLTDLPAAHSEVRARILFEAARVGWAALHRRLAQIDPEAAARIHPNDPQRIQRALEVFEVTGATLTEHHTRNAQASFPYQVAKLIVAPAERARLNLRIAARFQDMLARGLVEEVELLYTRGDLNSHLPSIRAVGYRQVWAYLQARYRYAELVERGIFATRQLAKRQLTWLRGVEGGLWFDVSCRSTLPNVLSYLARFRSSASP